MLEGYTDLPPGKVAAVVTYLELRAPPHLPPTPTMSDFAVRRVLQPDLDWYRKLYRVIGEPWLWFSRLRLSDDELRTILHDPAVDVFALSHAGEDHGLLEFDRRRFPDIELSFFGVTPALIGKGAGVLPTIPARWRSTSRPDSHPTSALSKSQTIRASLERSPAAPLPISQ